MGQFDSAAHRVAKNRKVFFSKNSILIKKIFFNSENKNIFLKI
jgi:hypothetical protein